MKTRVIINGHSQYNEYKRDDTGYIDGYVQAADNRAYAVVVKDVDNRLVMVELNKLIAVSEETTGE